jgi:hypothetical protein
MGRYVHLYIEQRIFRSASRRTVFGEWHIAAAATVS